MTTARAGRAAGTRGQAGVQRVLAGIPCSWGELVQGTVDGVDVLITSPVNRWTWATARWQSSPGPGEAPHGPAGRASAQNFAGWRVWRAGAKVQRALAELAAPRPGWIHLRSPLRPGAGCATSTADLCVALTAAAALQGRHLPPDELFARCLQVEPSDGIMFPGLALVDHRQGRHAASLGPPPPLAIAGLDPGGIVNTVAFNARRNLAMANRQKEAAVREALDLARRSIAAGDAAGLAAAATLSARAHQRLLPNPLWEPAQGWCRETGAIGLMVAHSGVVLGLLYDPRRADPDAVQRWLARRSGLPVRWLRLVEGGVRVATRR